MSWSWPPGKLAVLTLGNGRVGGCCADGVSLSVKRRLIIRINSNEVSLQLYLSALTLGMWMLQVESEIR